MKSPSTPTVKRLFAVSGNRCAFPNCTTPLVEPESGSIVGVVCHICGDKPDSARHNKKQTDEQRHGFDNLVLLCGVHHKVIDDDAESYTVPRLKKMKKEHEKRHPTPPNVTKEQVAHFAKVAIHNSKIRGSVVSSVGQTGGQTAHSITNNYGTAKPKKDEIKLDAKLEANGSLALEAATGCPGLILTVICRSTRPAKIKNALLLIDKVDLMKGAEAAFGQSFNYTPVPGSSETAVVKLIALSPPNSHEGFVLDRDDVVRFFYPLPEPYTLLTMRAKPADVWIAVEFFDGTERTLLKGKDVQGPMKSLFEMYKTSSGSFNGTVFLQIRVKSTTKPDASVASLRGTTNQNYFPMAEPGPEFESEPPKTEPSPEGTST